MANGKMTQKMPYVVDVEAGKKYAYCTCGMSSNQPYCNGSHVGTDFSPSIQEFEEDKKVAWCGCRQTNNGCFCDGSHSKA